MVYLRLPIDIPCGDEPLAAEIYLPSRMRGLSVCVTHSDEPAKRQRMCETLSDIGMATVLLQARDSLSSKHIIAAIDWVRTKRLLRKLPINIVATTIDERAAKRAAELRPVAVRSVLSTASVPHRLGLAVNS